MIRREHDKYYTPDDVAARCVSALPSDRPDLIIEPSVGGGSFVRAVKERWPTTETIGVDIDAYAPGAQLVTRFYQDDWPQLASSVAFRHSLAESGRILVVGNPPYKDAREHVEASLEIAGQNGVVAMLLRIGFLAGQKRRSFWAENQPHTVFVLSRRPSFTDGGTDASEYAWFVWRKSALPPALLWL